jgi:hypothetical protein
VWTCERPFGTVTQAGTATIAGVEAAGFCGVAAAPQGLAPSGSQRLTPLPRAPVLLRVRGEEGVLLAGAEVNVFGIRDSVAVPGLIPWPGRRPLFRGTTGPEGTLPVPPGVFATAACMEVRAEGHVPVSMDLSAAVRGPDIALVPLPTGAVRIAVTDEQGRPLEGASLLFEDRAHVGSSLGGAPPRTDADGTFRGILPEGTHRVLIHHPECALTMRSIVVSQSHEAGLDVRLAPGGTGFVRALGARGQPMSWQGIRAFVRDTPEDPTVAALRALPASVTDQHGRARVDGLPAGRPVDLQMVGSEERLAASGGLAVLESRSDRAPLVELRVVVPPGMAGSGPTVEIRQDGKTTRVPVANLGACELAVFVCGGGRADVTVSAGGARLEAKGVELVEGKATVIDLRGAERR